MSYSETMSERDSIIIDNITPDDSDADVPTMIDFSPRDNPDISVDTSGNFATHDIIGGDVVRQKIGEGEIQISVSGVCDEETAKQIDKLRRAKDGYLLSDRIEIAVQFASMSSEPRDSGGSVDMDTGDYLYTYTLNLVGIE